MYLTNRTALFKKIYNKAELLNYYVCLVLETVNISPEIE